MTEQKANDAEIIADFRRTYEQLLKTPVEHDHTTWSMRLTLEEMRALLAAVDERDELRRQGVGDFETGFAPVTVEKVIVEADPSRFMDALHFYQTKAATVAALPPIVEMHREHERYGGCPRSGTEHDCPLGGCPTFESTRETTVDDFPHGHPEVDAPDRELPILPADEGGPLDPDGPWIGRFGHAWPCPLFYVGNWSAEGRPRATCAGSTCESAGI